ncbi:MAG: TonB family protein [Parvibaculum sp.]
MSTSPEGRREAPRPTFHVVPPPVPRPKAWSEILIAVSLALVLNLLLLLPFILDVPSGSPPFEEPEAISVDLVPEPEAPPQPQPEAAPPPPEPVPQAEESGFTRSGGDSDEAPGDPGEEAPAEAARPEPAPDETVMQARDNAFEEDIPGWARTIEPGYDMRLGNPNASASAQAASPGGGGDRYLNAMGKRIVQNVVYPREAGGREGVAVIDLLVLRSGAVQSVRMVQSTGVPSLDRAALDAIQRSQPFAPFPANVTVRTAQLRLTLKITPRMR